MIRFYNGRVLTMDGGWDIREDEVWVDGSTVCYVGPARDQAPAFEREIDLKGNLLMPGFKNAHTHSAMTFCRSLADDLPLQPWLFDMIFPLEAKLTPERVYHLTKLAILEYLTSGVTAAFDMYYYRAMGVQACIDSGFRYVLCGMNGTPEAVEEEYTRFNSIHPLISLIPGIHAEYTTSVEDMKIISDLVHRHAAPFFTHISETESEVSGCLERHGMTPTELFDSLGLFDFGGGGYHCVYLTDHDMEIFRNRGLWAVTCPASNAKLAGGVAPLTKMQEKGLNLAIGTDGPSSNNALDMFREMYLACVLQKLQNRDAAAEDALNVLSMACTGSARAMGLPDCDCIAPGKQADLIVIDLDRPNMRPIINIPKNLVYSGSKDNVKLTMVAGRVLYEDGEFFIGEEPGRIYETAERIVKELTSE
ncbi:MAG: amidohydrolase [Oscillospiraceae bacterium]